MTTPLRGRFAAGVVFGAFAMLFGIVTHLTAELAGLGWRLDLALLLSGRHAYLGVIAAVCVLAAILALLAPAAGDGRARVRSLIAALPFNGEGPAFIAVTFLAQFVFFVVSQLGEGCPVRSGDVMAALLAAVLTALCGALAVTLGKRRMLEFVIALVCAIRSLALPRAQTAVAADGVPLAPAARCTPFSFRYRPPPQTA